MYVSCNSGYFYSVLLMFETTGETCFPLHIPKCPKGQLFCKAYQCKESSGSSPSHWQAPTGPGYFLWSQELGLFCHRILFPTGLLEAFQLNVCHFVREGEKHLTQPENWKPTQTLNHKGRGAISQQPSRTAKQLPPSWLECAWLQSFNSMPSNSSRPMFRQVLCLILTRETRLINSEQ